MKINSHRKQILEFSIEVEGAEVSELTPRLILEDVDVSYLIKGTIKNSKFIFEMPVFKNRIKSDHLTGKMEILIDDRHVSAWEGKFEIEKPASVAVSEATIAEGEPDVPIIRITSPSIVSKETPKPTVKESKKPTRKTKKRTVKKPVKEAVAKPQESLNSIYDLLDEINRG